MIFGVFAGAAVVSVVLVLLIRPRPDLARNRRGALRLESAFGAGEGSAEGAMEYRPLGRTDMKVSAISFGAWAIGGTWGPVDDEESMRALHAAIDAGVNFIDTADVYGDGRSERLVARLRRERQGETIYVATKAGRRLPEADARGLQPREPRRAGWSAA